MKTTLLILAISCVVAFGVDHRRRNNRRGVVVDNRQGKQDRRESSHHHPDTVRASSGNTDDANTQFWRSYFALYCTPSTGKMDVGQLYEAFKSWNFLRFSTETVGNVLAEHDADGDGLLDFNEFLTMGLIQKSESVGNIFDDIAPHSNNVLTPQGLIEATRRVYGDYWYDKYGLSSSEAEKAMKDFHGRGPTFNRLQFIQYIFRGTGKFDAPSRSTTYYTP